MKIGYLVNAYPEQRCIIGKTDSTYTKLNRRADLGQIRRKVRTILKMGGGKDWDAIFAYRTLFKRTDAKRVDLIHTFNHVCFGCTPWIVTFESAVPRTNYTVNRPWEKNSVRCHTDSLTEKELQLLADDKCKKIIALSNSAVRIQDYMLRNIAPKLHGDLMSKTLVLHPPQEILSAANDVKRRFNADVLLNRGLEFVFVGNDFFRKGGRQIIDVLLGFENEFKFHLTVISAMNYCDYASHASKNEQEKYIQIIMNKTWITWHNGLENKKVIEILKQSHVGLLPTLADTYGYSVLEMQACGLPVITTDIRALPEINNDDIGWMCHLAKDSIGGEAILTDENERENRKAELQTELTRIFKNIFESGYDEIARKGIRAMDRIREEHNPIKYGQKLMEIYNSSIAHENELR